MQRQIPLVHAVDETVNCGFIIIGVKEVVSHKPKVQAGVKRTSGQLRVICEHVFDARTADDKVIQISPETLNCARETFSEVIS